MQSEMSSSPAGGLRLPAGKHTSILTDLQTKDKEKIKRIQNSEVRFEIFLSTPVFAS